jgi:prepilin-type N-terminal cleavage/methylation domain-containing protein
MSKRNLKAGFTLVELLVTITIFVLLTGVVLFSQSKFNSTILLTNLAYDTALTIRQAQTYGINIKEFNTGSQGQFVPYGVHFDLTAPASFILFANLDYDFANETDDGIYDRISINPGISLASCQTENGCVNRYSIKRGNTISDLCVDKTGTTDGDCSTPTSLDIVFKRPNPDAFIRINNGGTTYNDATIVLKGADGVSIRKVFVQSNGLIEIKNN